MCYIKPCIPRIIQIGPDTTKLDFCGPVSHLGKVQYRIWNPNQNSKSKKKKIIQIGPETTKLDCCGQDSHLGKLQYRILNPYQISKSRKKIYSNRSRNNEIGLLWSGQSFWESTISNIETKSKFQVREEKYYSNRSKNNEIGLMWSGKSFWESTISNFESPLNFQVKEKKFIEIGQETTKLCFN